MLARCIVDEDLPGAFRNHPPTPILYYFFKDTSADQRSACRAMCMLLYQLLSFYPHLIRHALPTFKKHGTALSTMLSELCATFRAAATDPAAGKFICVLDALDECNEKEQLELISFLEDFCLARPSPSTAPHVKFLITSRPEFKIRQGFDKLLEASNNIELAGNDESKSIKQEIDLVIKHQVAKVRRDLRLSPQVANHLEKRLLGMEHRTYLWLYLIWDIVKRNQHGNKSSFNKLIDDLPADIEGCYERLLQKSTDPAFAHKVLQIVLVAARPLTVTELDVAVNIHAQTSLYADLEDELEGSCRVRDTLPSRCGMMISVIQSKVYFIHQTVKDFLLRRAGMGRQTDRAKQDTMYLTGSHLAMSRICLYNLCFRDIDLDLADICGALLPVEDRELKANEYCRDHAFLSYSAIYWADHYLQEDGQSPETVMKLLEPGRGRPVRGRYDVNYGSQLHAASAGGHVNIVQLLLDKDADVNAQGGVYGNALQAASRRGHETVVRILLEKGADVNAQGGVYGNALQAALWKGYETVIHMLLDKGADVNAQSGRYSNENVLQAASRGGYKTVVRMLLDKGADVNAQSSVYNNALQVASRGGYETIIRIFLDKGADINAQNSVYNNAL